MSHSSHAYPVEEFQKPIKGDPDEEREVKGQRVSFAWVAGALLVYALVLAYILGAR